MTKKATRTKELRPAKPAIRTAITPEGRSVESLSSSFADGVLREASQAFSSEEGALDFLVSSITSKLSGEGQEGAQMREFLGLILETDPALKEEILREIALRK